MIPAARALGIADPDEIAAVQAEIAAVETADRHFALGPLTIGVWTTVR
jgi:hypothetical protein